MIEKQKWHLIILRIYSLSILFDKSVNNFLSSWKIFSFSEKLNSFSYVTFEKSDMYYNLMYYRITASILLKKKWKIINWK